MDTTLDMDLVPSAHKSVDPVEIVYSLTRVDMGVPGKCMVIPHGIDQRNNTQYFNFEVIIGEDRFALSRRFQSFKALQQAMLTEILRIEPSDSNQHPCLHIIPSLPESGITKNPESLAKRQEELRIYLLKVIGHSGLVKLKSVQEFLKGVVPESGTTIIEKVKDNLWSWMDYFSHKLSAPPLDERVKALQEVVADQRKVLNWTQLEYKKYRQLQELNDLTAPKGDDIAKLYGQNVQQTEDPYARGLWEMQKYMIYLEEVIKQFESMIFILQIYAEKKQEYLALRAKMRAVTNTPQEIDPKSERGMMRIYIGRSGDVLNKEINLMNATAKEDLAYISKCLAQTITKLNQF